MASTIVLRQVVAPAGFTIEPGPLWFVSGARSPDIEITAPAPVQEVTSPITVAGQGHGFEGTILVQLRARTIDAKVLAEDVATAGSSATLEPFTAELSFDASQWPSAPFSDPTRVGFVLAADTSDASIAIPGFAAQVVVLGPGSGDPGTTPQPDRG